MLCKIQKNNAKRPRHYWQTALKKCDCGCKDRVYLLNCWYCLDRVKEILNDYGYSIEKNYNTGSAGRVSDW